MKPKMPSNTSLFAKRGDPWISERQRATDYNHNSSDNPDLDRYTKASQAKERHVRNDTKPKPRDPNDPVRKKMQFLMKAKAAARSQELRDKYKGKNSDT